MKRKTRPTAPLAMLATARIQRLTHDVEKLVLELEREQGSRALLAPAARSLERAVKALTTLTDDGKSGTYPEIRAVLEGTSPLMSLLGSRVVLADQAGAAPNKPSAGAQALALLLETPGRAIDATALAEHLACTVPMARTTLNRLVQSGHAVRASRGLFRAKS